MARVAAHSSWIAATPSANHNNASQAEDDKNIDAESKDKQHSFTLTFICRRAAKLANHELVNTPRVVVGRTLVFSLFAAIVLSAEAGVVRSILPVMLKPLQREVSSASTNTELKNHCQVGRQTEFFV